MERQELKRAILCFITEHIDGRRRESITYGRIKEMFCVRTHCKHHFDSYPKFAEAFFKEALASAPEPVVFTKSSRRNVENVCYCSGETLKKILEELSAEQKLSMYTTRKNGTVYNYTLFGEKKQVVSAGDIAAEPELAKQWADAAARTRISLPGMVLKPKNAGGWGIE